MGFTIRAAGGGGLESFSPSAIARVAFPVRENLWFQVEPYVGYARLTAYQGLFERRATIEDMALAGLHLVLIQHLYLDLEVGACVARHRGPDCFSSRKRAPLAPDGSGLSPGAAVDQTRGALAFSDVTVNAGIGWRFLW